MKILVSVRLVIAGLMLATSAACSEIAAETQAAPAAVSEVDAAVAEMFAEGRKSSADKPDFTRETVLKLNPIVERAKIALDRYDELTPQLAAAREAGDEARTAAIIAEYGKLKAEADAAHTAFQAEKKALLARDEYYNKIVLGAMEQFVAEAPQEIAEAIKQPAK